MSKNPLKILLSLLAASIIASSVFTNAHADTRTNQRATMRNIPDPTRLGPRIDKNTSAFLNKGNQSTSSAPSSDGPVPLPESSEIRPSPESIRKNAHRPLDETAQTLPDEKIKRNDLQPSSVD